MEYKWYVVRSISGKERKAKEYMEIEIRRMNAAELIPQVLIPMEKVYQVKNGKKVIRERSYLPGYILIEANLNPDLASVIKNIPNIIGFLGGDNPTPLREYEVNKILGRVDEMAELGGIVNHPFSIGDSVKVIDGPFNDFTGEIEVIDEDKRKLKVMVKILGRKTPIELTYLQVEKI